MKKIADFKNTLVSRKNRIRNMLFVTLMLLTLVNGCPCDPDPDTIDVSPDCPNGKAAASSITINASLSGIRPQASEKLLRVRGNRNPGADLCFADGAQVSFSSDVEGNGNVSQNITNLAHAQWSISITALSGGDHPLINIDQVLTPGSNHTLTITSNSSGDIVASF